MGSHGELPATVPRGPHRHAAPRTNTHMVGCHTALPPTTAPSALSDVQPAAPQPSLLVPWPKVSLALLLIPPSLTLPPSFHLQLSIPILLPSPSSPPIASSPTHPASPFHPQPSSLILPSPSLHLLSLHPYLPISSVHLHSSSVPTPTSPLLHP